MGFFLSKPGSSLISGKESFFFLFEVFTLQKSDITKVRGLDYTTLFAMELDVREQNLNHQNLNHHGLQPNISSNVTNSKNEF